jgi:hypothetical protein
MALPTYIQKTLVMKPEVNKLFDDLEEWLDHCRMELINFNPADLYKSREYKEWQREKNKQARFNRRDSKSYQKSV